MKIAIPALALLFFSATGAGAQTTTVSFDKFKNRTHFMTSKTQAGKVSLVGGRDASILVRRMEMIIGFSCEGQVDSCAPNLVEFLFIANTASWCFQGPHEVNLLMDGKPVALGKSTGDGTVNAGDDLTEYIDPTISPELLTTLSKAKSVDVEIGNFEFSLTDKNFLALKDAVLHLAVAEKK
jgi:hypothetical protein